MAHPKTSSSWLTWRSTVAVRRDPDDEMADVRFVKGAVARAVRTLRERRGDVALTERVIGLTAQAISERFAAAARSACRSSLLLGPVDRDRHGPVTAGSHRRLAPRLRGSRLLEHDPCWPA